MGPWIKREMDQPAETHTDFRSQQKSFNFGKRLGGADRFMSSTTLVWYQTWR
jgi:hypothetical protein